MKVQTTILLSRPNYEWVKKAAIECNRSMAGYIEFLIITEQKRLKKTVIFLRCLLCNASWSTKIGLTCPTCKDAGVPVEYEEK